MKNILNKNKIIMLIILFVIIFSILIFLKYNKNRHTHKIYKLNASKIEKTNTVLNQNQGIAVLNYHFLYDQNDPNRKCYQTICLSTDKFKTHLQYFKEEGFKTLSIEEFTKWMYGEIELPEKSVLLTFDDGAFNLEKYLPNLLNEYNAKATLFLITAWYDKSIFYSQNLDIQSHGYDIHTNGTCGQTKALCLNHDDLLQDLKKSITLVDNSLTMAYPFYKYNNNVIQTVKDAGFKLAFAGGQSKAYRTSNKYAVPRYVIYDSTSLEQIKKYVN